MASLCVWFLLYNYVPARLRLNVILVNEEERRGGRKRLELLIFRSVDSARKPKTPCHEKVMPPKSFLI